ncbi:MAG: VOC family protein [Gammaproteobacteria bacterium]|nr:VOC family protein [Gammaproteobacteria bacterium]MDH4314071.1 VOC family protein [Gammaproteobacteria bacterium]MDH5213114.1 VOC family protein [Gammaproteobacteria bacterium]
MNRVFPFVSFPVKQQASSAGCEEALEQRGSAKSARHLASPAAALMSVPYPLKSDDKCAAHAGRFAERARTSLNRLAVVCLLALFSQVTPADDAKALPPLPPLADPPTHLQLPGKFVWADLFVEDDDKARQFYSQLLGWTWRTIGSGPDAYDLAENDGIPIAGLVQRDRQKGEVAGGIWISYVSVPDPGASASQIVSLGGKTLVPVTQVNGRGDFAIFSDPAGALFGIARSDSGDPPDYQSRIGDWIWIQLAARDATQAAKFYSAVAGFDMTERPDTGAAEDLLLVSGGYARAGISQVDDDRPPVWVPFVRVGNAAGAAERAVALGAELILPPQDDIMGGDLVVIADPAGAVLGLLTWDYEETGE